jgi:hypothetical protein
MTGRRHVSVITIAAIIAVAVVGVAIGIVLPLGPGQTPPSEVLQENIERVLGRAISEREGIEVIEAIFAADNGESAYCCGAASCVCTDLGDCINLWFADVCANIPGPDIVGGMCEKKIGEGCSNDNCSCPD